MANDSSQLRLEHRGLALLAQLDRPDRRNALTVELTRELGNAILSAVETGARAVIITGAPPAFSSGGDLPQIAGIAERGALETTDVIYGNFQRLVKAIRDCPLPVIAAVNGIAFGAGLDLALACDLRVSSSDARFASSWINLGLVPGMGGAHFLTKITGSGRAAELLLLGRELVADEALQWGIVNEVVSPENLLDRCDEIVQRLADLPPTGLARTKAAIHREVDAGLDAELAVLGATQGALLTSEQFRAAVEHALNRRKRA